MTVRIVDLQSDLAIHVLSQKLSNMGVQVYGHQDAENRIQAQCREEDIESLQRLLLTFILTDWLFALIDKRLATLHSYLTEDEREYVALLVFHSLRKDNGSLVDLAKSELGQRIEPMIHDLLEGDRPIAIEGIVRFRLRDYLLSVDGVIHEMVEQFLTDREYEEFVSMLRYLLDAQPPSSQVLHVYCTDDLVWICDEQGTLVRDTEVAHAAHHVSDEEDVNVEDLSMSILITRSPCKIVIHDQTQSAPWPSFPETLERVFLDRASRCDGCATCHELNKPSQDTPGKSNGGTSIHLALPGQAD